MYAYPKVEYLIRMYHILNNPKLPEDYPEWQRQLVLVIENAIGSIQAADDMQHELFMILDLLESEGLITEWQNSKNG